MNREEFDDLLCTMGTPHAKWDTRFKILREYDLLISELNSLKVSLKSETETTGRLMEENIRLREAQRWIPISERLPDVDPNDRCGLTSNWVLICSASDQFVTKGYVYLDDGQWNDESGEISGITHWMPLPEPPALEEK